MKRVLALLKAEPGQTPAGMLPLVDRVAPVPFVDTRLSTRPFWMLVDLRGVDHHTTTVAFTSRHAVNLTCWDTAHL